MVFLIATVSIFTNSILLCCLLLVLFTKGLCLYSSEEPNFGFDPPLYLCFRGLLISTISFSLLGSGLGI